MSLAMELAEETQVKQSDIDTDDKGKRGRPKGSKGKNPFMKPINLSMYHNQFVPDGETEVNSFYNREYVFDKLVREFVQPLNTQGKTDLIPVDKEEWLEIANKAWEHYLTTAQRAKQKKLLELLSDFKNDEEAREMVLREFGVALPSDDTSQKSNNDFDEEDFDEEEAKEEVKNVKSSSRGKSNAA